MSASPAEPCANRPTISEATRVVRRDSAILCPLLAEFVESAFLQLFLSHNSVKLDVRIEGKKPRLGQGGNP